MRTSTLNYFAASLVLGSTWICNANTCHVNYHVPIAHMKLSIILQTIQLLWSFWAIGKAGLTSLALDGWWLSMTDVHTSQDMIEWRKLYFYMYICSLLHFNWLRNHDEGKKETSLGPCDHMSAVEVNTPDNALWASLTSRRFVGARVFLWTQTWRIVT